ncbi:MAG: aspartate aminotransferase family protein [Gammaproteobacteria bacterium]|nr:MAG: aspartate aminotransferase family protein [Gammaproteobacteria bacterium]
MNAREHEAQHLLQVYGQLPIEPSSAMGVYLHVGDRRIIDFYGGHAVTALGYGHPAMLQALEKQARTLIFQSNAVAMEVRANAADALAAFAPGALNHVFFTNSGAESNENALRIACKLTGRSHVVAIEHGFHGRTAAAGAVTWNSQRWYGFPNRPFDVDFIPRDDVGAVAATITEQTAAVILELVQGLAGAHDLDAAFVRAIAKTCKERGALLIIDEVQTGIGRCGQPFATNIYRIEPDMLTVAKSVAGGLPCGALIVTNAIAGSVGPGDLGSTFGGGPLACALVQTVLEVIQRDKLMDNIRHLSHLIADACPVGPVDSVQGKGFLLGLRVRRNAAAVRSELLERDILVGTSTDPHVIRLLPPYILEQQHVQKLIEALAELPDE